MRSRHITRRALVEIKARYLRLHRETGIDARYACGVQHALEWMLGMDGEAGKTVKSLIAATNLPSLKVVPRMLAAVYGGEDHD